MTNLDGKTIENESVAPQIWNKNKNKNMLTFCESKIWGNIAPRLKAI